MTDPTLYVQVPDDTYIVGYRLTPISPETCPGHAWVTVAIWGEVSEHWLTPNGHHTASHLPWLNPEHVHCRYCGAHPEEGSDER